jgi:hypothetical protein
MPYDGPGARQGGKESWPAVVNEILTKNNRARRGRWEVETRKTIARWKDYTSAALYTRPSVSKICPDPIFGTPSSLMTTSRKKDSIYVEMPEDVQEAIRILLLYFDQPRIGNPRPLYRKTLKRAQRILDIKTDWRVPQSEPNKWMTPTKESVIKRLELVGLDPDDPMRVVNQERWNSAWEQLLKTEKFNEAEQRQAIASGKEAPQAESVMSVVVTAQQKKARTAGKPRSSTATSYAEFTLPKLG